MYRILRQIGRCGQLTEPLPPSDRFSLLGERLQQEVRRSFRGSLTIRAVDAGSCNGCELEMHAAGNPFYDIERFGIHFTASPRFADMLLVTGPVGINMKKALEMTYEAMPRPGLVVAMGDCAADCGLFGRNNYAIAGAVADIIPVDAVIHGCPPTPVDLIQGILAAIEGQDGTAQGA